MFCRVCHCVFSRGSICKIMLCLLCFLAPGVLARRSTNRQRPFQIASAQTDMLLAIQLEIALSLEQELLQGVVPNPAMQNCDESCQTDDSMSFVDDMFIAALLRELDFFEARPAAGKGGGSSGSSGSSSSSSGHNRSSSSISCQTNVFGLLQVQLEVAYTVAPHLIMGERSSHRGCRKLM